MRTPSELTAGARGATHETEAAHDLACEIVYRFLAGAFSDPRFGVWQSLCDGCSLQLTFAAADLLRSEFAGDGDGLGFGELPAEELDLRHVAACFPPDLDGRDAEFVRVFGLVSNRACPPYETEFDALEDTFYRSQQMADIGGFYRAFGLAPGGDGCDRPDHLVLELEFSALLLMKKRRAAHSGVSEGTREQAAICQAAREKFFRDHFGWWTPAFAAALRLKAEAGPYEALGRALAAFVAIDRRRLGLPPAPAGVRPRPADRIDEPEGCLVQLAGLPPGAESPGDAD